MYIPFVESANQLDLSSGHFVNIHDEPSCSHKWISTCFCCSTFLGSLVVFPTKIILDQKFHPRSYFNFSDLFVWILLKDQLKSHLTSSKDHKRIQNYPSSHNLPPSLSLVRKSDVNILDALSIAWPSHGGQLFVKETSASHNNSY